MAGGAIVPLGDNKDAPAAAPAPPVASPLALALASQEKHFAKKYEEMRDEADDIDDEVVDRELTRAIKHRFSDEPNWMVNAITGACARWHRPTSLSLSSDGGRASMCHGNHTESMRACDLTCRGDRRGVGALLECLDRPGKTPRAELEAHPSD